MQTTPHGTHLGAGAADNDIHLGSSFRRLLWLCHGAGLPTAAGSSRWHAPSPQISLNCTSFAGVVLNFEVNVSLLQMTDFRFKLSIRQTQQLVHPCCCTTTVTAHTNRFEKAVGLLKNVRKTLSTLRRAAHAAVRRQSFTKFHSTVATLKPAG